MCDSIARNGGRGFGSTAMKNIVSPIWVICLATILAGCTTPDLVDPAASVDHSANPAASPSSAPKPTATLSIPDDGNETTGMPEMAPDSGSMHHKMHGPGDEEKPPMEHKHHGGVLQDAEPESKGHHHGHGTAK